jgi:hypothetical protein
MRSESTTGYGSSAALGAAATPRSPWRVTSVQALPGWTLRVTFADGSSGNVNLSGFVQLPRAGVFAALADPAVFAQVRLEYGAVTWPGDLDLAPDAMHAAIREHGEWRL